MVESLGSIKYIYCVSGEQQNYTCGRSVGHSSYLYLYLKLAHPYIESTLVRILPILFFCTELEIDGCSFSHSATPQKDVKFSKKNFAFWSRFKRMQQTFLFVYKVNVAFNVELVSHSSNHVYSQLNRTKQNQTKCATQFSSLNSFSQRWFWLWQKLPVVYFFILSLG